MVVGQNYISHYLFSPAQAKAQGRTMDATPMTLNSWEKKTWKGQWKVKVKSILEKKNRALLEKI